MDYSSIAPCATSIGATATILLSRMRQLNKPAPSSPNWSNPNVTPRQQSAQALRAVASEIEAADDPAEVLRLAALATWRLREVTNSLPEPEQPIEPAKPDDRKT